MSWRKLFYTISILSIYSCMDEPEDIPEICLDQMEYHWTVNGEFQDIPGGEDPFTGGNPNTLFSVRTQGDWSVIFNSEDYFFNFNQMERVISGEELLSLSDEAYKEAIENRGKGDIRDIVRVDFNVTIARDSSIWLGKENLVEGVYFTMVETDPKENCCFLDLYIQAEFEHATENYEMDFMLKTPYHCEKRH
jgi:hypothetical protein